MTAKITVFGLVQGVGYRPFVVRMARELGICGYVKNSGGIVVIIANGSKEAIDSFVNRLKSHIPTSAQVNQILVEATADKDIEGFYIAESSGEVSETPLISPDLPLCEDCRRELYDTENRRYRYPMISCVACGPRYSIIESLPYDRDTTSMGDFGMCGDCFSEYITEENRRRHAQTISCHSCGPQLILRLPEGELHGEEALNNGIRMLIKGSVLAVKGIGGYHFCCLPTDESVVERLRMLKRRDKKPFAVMFPDIRRINDICKVNAEEEKLLISAATPIVLLEKKEDIFCSAVSGESRFIGAFLPYTPLQRLLADACGPLVATSGNFSGEPVIIKDEEMLTLSSPFLDGVLCHTRKIQTPLDDTVVRVVNSRPQMIRRGRGVTPLPIFLGKSFKNPLLAMGGDLKSCFCLLAGDRAYLSQYFGDMESYPVARQYRENLARMERLFSINPRFIVHDLHPGYETTRLARKLGSEKGIPLIAVQHHHAHAASVMAEYNLSSCIGVAFDGTGYGTDGAIWGGEFLLCNGAEFTRSAHLEYISLCGGNSGVENARITAYSYLARAGIGVEDKDYDAVRAAVGNRINVHNSSSMGRLFDSVSALLGIREFNTYEGECAIALENLAAEFQGEGGYPYPLRFKLENKDGHLLCDQVGLFADIFKAKQSGINTGALALGFHEAVATMVEEVCLKIREEHGENKVSLCGGVFGNLLLLKDCINRLSAAGFNVYINSSVPANDGGISLGQAWIGGLSLT